MATSYGTSPMRRIGRDDDRGSLAPPALAVGGLIMLVGTFLGWASGNGDGPNGANGNRSLDLAGFEMSDGRVAMGIGFALLLLAVLMFLSRRADAWNSADLLGATLATVGLVVIVATLADLAGSGGPSADIGLFVSLIGSLIALAGALIGLLRDASDRRDHLAGDDVDTVDDRRVA